MGWVSQWVSIGSGSFGYRWVLQWVSVMVVAVGVGDGGWWLVAVGWVLQWVSQWDSVDFSGFCSRFQ